MKEELRKRKTFIIIFTLILQRRISEKSCDWKLSQIHGLTNPSASRSDQGPQSLSSARCSVPTNWFLHCVCFCGRSPFGKKLTQKAIGKQKLVTLRNSVSEKTNSHFFLWHTPNLLWLEYSRTGEISLGTKTNNVIILSQSISFWCDASCLAENSMISSKESIKLWMALGDKVKSVGKSALKIPDIRNSTFPPV